MWAARSIKYNGLALQKMMQDKFVGDLQSIRDTFSYKNLAGTIFGPRWSGDIASYVLFLYVL